MQNAHIIFLTHTPPYIPFIIIYHKTYKLQQYCKRHCTDLSHSQFPIISKNLATKKRSILTARRTLDFSHLIRDPTRINSFESHRARAFLSQRRALCLIAPRLRCIYQGIYPAA